MSEVRFLEGVRIERKEFNNGGFIFKGSINLEKIHSNPVNDGKYINFEIKQGKSGKWYACLDEYKYKNQAPKAQ